MIVTNIDQSKKLLEIGIDPNTADVVWLYSTFEGEYFPHIKGFGKDDIIEEIDVPAWSLSKLLDILNFDSSCYCVQLVSHDGVWTCQVFERGYGISIESSSADNQIDACIETIVKLKEKNILK